MNTAICTSDLYHTDGCLPARFERPNMFQNYGKQKYVNINPRYMKTSLQYGFYPPTIHTVPTRYYPLNNKFSRSVYKGGMFRNFSLNI
ncbi:hypothetical protein PGB90_010091 [Kerria lacca]